MCEPSYTCIQQLIPPALRVPLQTSKAALEWAAKHLYRTGGQGRKGQQQQQQQQHTSDTLHQTCMHPYAC
jgi:hypothetical protein